MANLNFVLSSSQLESRGKLSASNFKLLGGGRVMAETKGNAGRGDKGAGGGTRRRDGSGKGVGNRGTSRQPKRKAKK